LKPCRKAVSKTHNVARSNYQDETDSTGLVMGYTIPPHTRTARIGFHRYFLSERRVESGNFLDDSAPPGYD
jgi:hypothetical protein